MSREIVEAMRALASEKGINPDRLIAALEDALLSAYKKQPDSAQVRPGRARPRDRRLPRHRAARPRAPRGAADRRDDRRGHRTSTPRPASTSSPRIRRSTRRSSRSTRDQIEERDVTPEDFGRIAAQTAKQVILQRIREAERDMMYEEYRDRVGELDHGHRPAVRLPLHARAAARARRGAAARAPSRSTASATTTGSASRP